MNPGHYVRRDELVIEGGQPTHQHHIPVGFLFMGVPPGA